VEGAQVVLRGAGYTDKSNPRPLLWWTADGGDNPSSLGRITVWPDRWDGLDEPTTKIVAPGSTQAYRYDHGASSGAALGRVYFESDRLYMWRKKYDDFDITLDYGVQAKTRDRSGSFEPGQMITGQSSGTTGVIQRITDGSFYLDNTQGSVANGADFSLDEKITSATGTAYIRGMRRSFNYKTWRLWSSGQNNAVANAHHSTTKFDVAAVYTESFNVDSDLVRQVPRVWNIEEMVYETSDVGVRNGTLIFGINNNFTENTPVKTRNSEYPNRYESIVMSQVSNGAQLGSWVYYDSVYLDVTWHRVLLSSSPRWEDAKDIEIQIPVAWNDSEISIEVRFGSLSGADDYFLYVVDAEGQVNAEGYPVSCALCPKPPASVTVQ
jgi:hypothetical protein